MQEEDALSAEGRVLVEAFGSLLFALLNELMVRRAIEPAAAKDAFVETVARFGRADTAGVSPEQRQAIVEGLKAAGGI